MYGGAADSPIDVLAQSQYSRLSENYPAVLECGAILSTPTTFVSFSGGGRGLVEYDLVHVVFPDEVDQDVQQLLAQMSSSQTKFKHNKSGGDKRR